MLPLFPFLGLKACLLILRGPAVVARSASPSPRSRRPTPFFSLHCSGPFSSAQPSPLLPLPAQQQRRPALSPPLGLASSPRRRKFSFPSWAAPARFSSLPFSL